jgi:hypothetical protein
MKAVGVGVGVWCLVLVLVLEIMRLVNKISALMAQYHAKHAPPQYLEEASFLPSGIQPVQ